jgi:large subunit ribosomal protein L15
MKLHEIKSVAGSRRSRKRVGRGIAAGQGKTAGRGTKGAGARSGSGGRLYREGGNLPFVRKLPFKRGFTNLRRLGYVEVNVDDIEARFDAGAEVNPETLAQAGFMKDTHDGPVVVLGRGELTKAVNVRAHRFSQGALEKINAAGGSVGVLDARSNE